MKAPVWWLPLAFFLWSLATVLTSCTIAYASGIMLAAFLCAAMVVAIYLRTLHVNPPTSSWNRVQYDSTLAFGLMGILFVGMMSWVTVNDFPVLHLVFAIGAFVFFFLYASSNSILRIRLAMAMGTGGLQDRVLCIITSVIGLILWQALDTHCLDSSCPKGNPVGSSIAQYCIVGSIWLYFLPYTWEFKNTQLVVQFSGSEPWLSVEEEEDSSSVPSTDKRGV